MMKQNGIFIVFEGIDGAGKTCQMENIKEYMLRRGIDVVLTREPGGTVVGEKIRELLLNPAHQNMDDRCELLLYGAARAQHLKEVIIPALKQGQAVLCDRFHLSTVAYQGYGRGISRSVLEAVNDIATDGLSPDLTVILDVPAEVGFQRIRENREAPKDRLEQEKRAFFQKVREGYLKEAGERRENYLVVNGDRQIEAVAADIKKALEPLL
ncbi:MAG TPA: dTMP kinase [Clostridiales bacterium]|nr:dTMP kinase [Clostridiales bacterium]